MTRAHGNISKNVDVSTSNEETMLDTLGEAAEGFRKGSPATNIYRLTLTREKRFRGLEERGSKRGRAWEKAREKGEGGIRRKLCKQKDGSDRFWVRAWADVLPTYEGIAKLKAAVTRGDSAQVLEEPNGKVQVTTKRGEDRHMKQARRPGRCWAVVWGRTVLALPTPTCHEANLHLWV